MEERVWIDNAFALIGSLCLFLRPHFRCAEQESHRQHHCRAQRVDFMKGQQARQVATRKSCEPVTDLPGVACSVRRSFDESADLRG